MNYPINIPKKDPNLRPFAVWGDVLAHVAAGHTIYYSGPLDYMAHKVEARVIGEVVRVHPPTFLDFDAFSADWQHLDRFGWYIRHI